MGIVPITYMLHDVITEAPQVAGEQCQKYLKYVSLYTFYQFTFCYQIPCHRKFIRTKFNALSDVTVRVQPSANGVLMQSTICLLCLDLIHHGRFILQDFSNKYVMGKIDMSAVVDLMKYHQINMLIQSNVLLDVNVRVQLNATGALMQSTFYRIYKLLIHYG